MTVKLDIGANAGSVVTAFERIKESLRQAKQAQRDPTVRRRRRPRELALFQPLGQHAQADPVMPNQLDEPGAATPKGQHGTVEWIGGQALLHQHRQSRHALTHVGNPAGQIDPQPRRQRDHRPSSAPSTRRSARPSTWASTRNDTPEGSTISIKPSA